MSTNKFSLYFFANEDGELVDEIKQLSARGRKSVMMRNLALMGYQRAQQVCAEITDPTQQMSALAAVFGTKNLPDFRAASDFLRANSGADAKAAQRPSAPAAEASAAPVVPEVAARPKRPAWGELGAMVAGASNKDKE